jgi:predicted MPP superfamily phosphohydrolase
MNENELTNFHYLLPLIIIVAFIIIIFLALKISELLYSYIYLIFGLYLGYIFYLFQIALVFKIILAFTSLPENQSLILLYLLPLIICIYGIINALKTKIEKITLKYPGYNGKIKILHLSDIHLGAIHQKGSVLRIVDEIQEIDPDIVVITGDMADGSLKVKPSWLMPFNNLVIPILYVTGNHEEMNPKEDMIKIVNQTNIKYIGNHEKYKFKGVNFIGEDFGYDLRKYLTNIKREPGIPNVLLYHVPNLVPDELENYNIFLFLAGHTHGGQIFPLGILAYLTNACFSGLYIDKTKSHYIYVSEGVNNAVVPMRVGSSRIFALITIEGYN